MPKEPSREYARVSAMELDGRPLEITSAELVWIQHWRGDEPAQREWELAGRTFDPALRDHPQPVVLTLGDGRRFRGRVVLRIKESGGYAAFTGVGLGDLVEVREPPVR